MEAPVAVRRALAALGLVALGSAWGCSRVEKAPFVPTLDGSSRRSTQDGDVVGFQGPYGNHAWLGIPFARPPVGELRWRAPEPPDRWSGVREALASGSKCPQFANPIGGEDGVEPGTPIGSEDCLYLNVFAPRFPEGEVPTGAERLPVMVWIHGGGNTIGHAGFYEAGNLAATHRVVVVATNYRLGPLGWFRHASLRGAGTSPAEHSGNFGTLDLLHALRWVRENAAAFGGDPGKVTIFGESAGGRNVYSLLLSPLARGLFHRAIAQSGGIGLETRAHAEHLADDPDPGEPASSGETVLRLVELAGQAQDREGAKARVAAFPPDEMARWLRARNDREILAAYVSGGSGMIHMPNVFRDGVVLPDADAQTLLASGRYNRVPAVLGSNRDENKLFMALDPRHTMLIKGVPLWVKDPDRYQREAGYRSAMWKASAVDEPAAAMSRAQGPSVFAYRFDWDELPRILWVDLARILGASHGFEIPFVFGHFDLGRSARLLWSADSEPGRRALSAAMMSYWAQFAATGDPARGRAGDLPRWEAFGGELPEGARLLVLDTAEGGGIRVSRDTASVEDLVARIEADGSFEDARERCELLASLMTWTPQFTRERYARIAACSGLGPLASR